MHIANKSYAHIQDPDSNTKAPSSEAGGFNWLNFLMDTPKYHTFVCQVNWRFELRPIRFSAALPAPLSCKGSTPLRGSGV